MSTVGTAESAAAKAVRQDQKQIDANREIGINARRVLEQLLKVATTPGYYGKVIVSISAENGTLRTIEEDTHRTHKVITMK